jgi:hypothetical protein
MEYVQKDRTFWAPSIGLLISRMVSCQTMATFESCAAVILRSPWLALGLRRPTISFPSAMRVSSRITWPEV